MKTDEFEGLVGIGLEFGSTNISMYLVKNIRMLQIKSACHQGQVRVKKIGFLSYYPGNIFISSIHTFILFKFETHF